MTNKSEIKYVLHFFNRLACNFFLIFPGNDIRKQTGKNTQVSWWRHQTETFSVLVALCAGKTSVTGEFPHKGQWRGALMFTLICAWINGWLDNREAGDLTRHRAHYDVIIMISTTNNSCREYTRNISILNLNVELMRVTMTSWHVNTFRITGLVRWEWPFVTSWSPSQMISNVGSLCFFPVKPEHTVQQRVYLPVI